MHARHHRFIPRVLAVAAVAWISAGLVAPHLATAQDELGVDAIVERANNVAYYQGDDGRADVKMTIYGSSGNKRVRELTMLRRDDPGGDGGDQKLYVYFHEPADVAKMVFVVHKKTEGTDDRWLYLPNLDLVKRIAASDKRTSFVGSDFVYEDVSGRGIDQDEHELTKTTKSYYVLKHTPKDAGAVEFAWYKMWIHRDTFLPTKVEYYDKQGNKQRVMTVDSVAAIQGYTTVEKMTMENLDSGTKTVVEYSGVEYDIGLPAKLFTERYLRRAPVKYLKAK
jgi:outer membrane lipoprotein-sorting protein